MAEALATQASRGHRTLCLPFEEESYRRVVNDPAEFRRTVDACFRNAPELFPAGFGRGYQLKDGRLSAKRGLLIRRILLRDGVAYSVRPSFLTAYMAARAQFLERRLLWQFKTPIRSRVAITIRDLICFEGQRCRHGHTVDVRLTHQDLSELVGAARPVVSAELVRLRDEGLVSYTRSYFCVEDLSGLSRVAAGEADFAELSSG